MTVVLHGFYGSRVKYGARERTVPRFNHRGARRFHPTATTTHLLIWFCKSSIRASSSVIRDCCTFMASMSTAVSFP
uniref:Uncharacterized protein n=1 Tax=Candidatus Kentrum sp. LFY TaxID=2126342 RepID=A0A450V7C2_9GAMM|nr:MAG: hypothetical protein BECKLFY1418B_GA0070995_12031 [Candidatus Kentron sp. LFY]